MPETGADGAATSGDASTAMPRIDAIIQTAMAAELVPFAQAATDLSPVQTWGQASWRTATFEGRTVVLAQSGIGLVNAASCLTWLLARFSPALVVSAGSAGGFPGAVVVGNVVVGDTMTYSTADAVAFGYQLGQIPGMPVAFEADPASVAAALQVEGVVAGQLVAGDMFIAEHLLSDLRERFPDAVATDMESTAVAQVAHSAGVPMISVRGISDLCGPAAQSDHAETLDDVSTRSMQVVRAVLGT